MRRRAVERISERSLREAERIDKTDVRGKSVNNLAIFLYMLYNPNKEGTWQNIK